MSIGDKQINSVGLFGIGKSNLGVIDYLKRKYPGLTVTVRCDSEPDSRLLSTINADRILIGADAHRDINEDALFLSPSIRRDLPALICAKNAGVRLCSDAELFFDEVKRDVYGVTGSDGKSSCTYLLSRMLDKSAIPSLPCGNFGVSLSTLIDSQITPVAELSSFQLMYIKPKLRRAIITNITKNHLNWHKSYGEYINAKLNIAENTDELVADADSQDLMGAIRKRTLFCAVSTRQDYASLKSAVKALHYITCSGDDVILDGGFFFSIRNAIRKEDYNRKNYLLSAGAALEICDSKAIAAAVTGFRGLPHRAELVAENGKIRYVNSSIDSSPQRTASTLSSFSGDVAVLIGGLSKNLALDPLLNCLFERAVGAVLSGPVGYELFDRIKADKRYRNFKIAFSSDMSNAIMLAENMLTRGGTVLLSPAATSFDRYSNFEERGEDFRLAVHEHIFKHIKDKKNT